MALIRRFLIAPNNKLYVEFLNNSMIEGLPCLLAEIERDSGIPKCIERDTDFRFLGVGQDPRVFCDCPEERPLRNDIQFDKIGNIYYAGIPGTWIKDSPNSKGIGTGPTSCAASPCRMASVVRRFSNGAIRDFGSCQSRLDKGGNARVSALLSRAKGHRFMVVNWTNSGVRSSNRGKCTSPDSGLEKGHYASPERWSSSSELF